MKILTYLMNFSLDVKWFLIMRYMVRNKLISKKYLITYFQPVITLMLLFNAIK